MMRAVLIVFLVLFTSIYMFSQTVIKEKVEIAPKQKNNPSVQSHKSHSVSAQFTWDSPTVPGLLALFACDHWITSPDSWHDGGYYSIQGYASGYITVRYYVNADLEQTVQSHIKVYLDSIKIADFDMTFFGGYVYDVPAYSPREVNFFSDYADFDLSTDDLLCRNGFSDDIVLNNLIYADCSSPNTFDAYDLITVSVTSGSEYVSVIKNWDTEHASAYQTYSLSEGVEINLWQNKPIPGNSPLDINVEVSVNGIVHDKTIQILAPRYVMNAAISETYTVHNDIPLISIETREPDCGGLILLDEVRFNAKITSGSNFGSLRDPITGQSGIELTGISHNQGSFLLNFVADGDVPQGTEIIEIQITATDPAVEPITLTLPIQPATLAASFNTDYLAMGDTAVVHIMHLLPDGTAEEIPDQRFNVDIIQGGASSMLIDPMSGQSGTTLYAVPNDFLIVSAESISTDSLLVRMHIGTFCDVCMSGSIRFHSDDTSKSVWKGNQKRNGILKDSTKFKYLSAIASKKQSSGKDIVESVKGNPSSSGKYKKVSEYYGDFSGVAKIWEKKPTLEITKPTKDSPPELISSEPKMPTVTCEAHLNNYKNGAVTFEWVYSVSYKLKRHDLDNHKFVALATRDAEIRFTGSSIANNSNTTSWLVPFNTDHIDYLKFKAQQPQRNPKYHRNYGGDTNKVITGWTDGFDVFIGGYVFVQVTAKNADGYIIGFKQDTVNKILGENPDINSVYYYAGSNEMKAILIHEAKTKQFASDNTNWPQYETGWPLYGYPNGYGLMQLDNSPPPTENQLWNWKANLDGGKAKFLNFYTQALKNVQKYKNTNMDINKIALINAYQQYNSGKDYFLWSKDDKFYENPSLINDYGISVYNKYLELIH